MASATERLSGPPPSEAPPATEVGVIGWIRENLFNSWTSAVLTIVSVFIVYALIRSTLSFLAQSDWTVVTSNLTLFAIGQYPREEAWRTIAALVFVVVLGIGHLILWNRSDATRRVMTGLWFISFPVVWIILRGSRGTLLWRLIALFVLLGVLAAVLRFIYRRYLPQSGLILGILVVLWQLAIPGFWFLLGLSNNEALGGIQAIFPSVRSQLWSGMLLTVMLTVVGIVVSFPLGVLLALGRRSDMIIVKILSTIYIEAVRGVPLISILFMAQVMLPLFVGNSSLDVVIRAMAGVTLFSAAYLAENVRGGLQAIPKGQVEAAQALGLSAPQITSLIVLPQALRIVIPAIVGQFISLFKDTTLVSIITLLDLLGISEAALAQDPSFQNHKTEVYIFLAAIYFVFSYIMSSAARRIEAGGSGMGGTRKL